MADAVVAAEADACEGCAAPSCAASVKPHRTHVVVCVGINFTHEKTPPNIELADHGPLVLCAKIAQAVQDVKGLKVTACSIRSRNAKTFAKRTLGSFTLMMISLIVAMGAYVVYARAGGWTALVLAVSMVYMREKRGRRVCDAEAGDAACDVAVYSRDRPGALWRVRESQLASFAKALEGANASDEAQLFWPMPLPWKHLLLVCTHASRDKRCGRAGPPLIEALEEEAKKKEHARRGIRVAESSHIGGHKFAGTLVHYPSAEWFGLVTKRDAPELLRHCLAGTAWPAKARGNGFAAEAPGPKPPKDESF